MAKIRETFTTPYDQHASREGQRFTVVQHITQNTPEIDVSEVGPMYEIEFEDGVRIHAWPEEVEE